MCDNTRTSTPMCYNIIHVKCTLRLERKVTLLSYITRLMLRLQLLLIKSKDLLANTRRGARYINPH